jgi:hypothetical protein
MSTIPFKVILAAAEALDVAYELAVSTHSTQYKQLLDARNDMRIYVRIILSSLPPVEVGEPRTNPALPQFLKQGAIG